jgi:hypothetical protein
LVLFTSIRLRNEQNSILDNRETAIDPEGGISDKIS